MAQGSILADPHSRSMIEAWMVRVPGPTEETSAAHHPQESNHGPSMAWQCWKRRYLPPRSIVVARPLPCGNRSARRTQARMSLFCWLILCIFISQMVRITYYLELPRKSFVSATIVLLSPSFCALSGHFSLVWRLVSQRRPLRISATPINPILTIITKIVSNIACG